MEQTSIGTISGPVTCLTVGGMNNNQARIQWTVMHSDITGVNKGTSRQLDVTDMGEPVMGVSLDKFSDEGECDPGTYCMTNCCECDMTPGGSQPIMNGNIVVKSSTTM